MADFKALAEAFLELGDLEAADACFAVARFDDEPAPAEVDVVDLRRPSRLVRTLRRASLLH
jgi:hypothetical protein